MPHRPHHKSTDQLIATDSSIEELFIPPNELSRKSAEDERTSTSPPSSNKQNKTNKTVVAAADVHAPSLKPQYVRPVPAPRRSLTTAFEFKDSKNMKNLKEKENAAVKERSSTSVDDSDSVPLIEMSKRVRPFSAKPSKARKSSASRRKTVLSKENESSNSAELRSVGSKKDLEIQKREKNEDDESNSVASYAEKNEYEMYEITSASQGSQKESKRQGFNGERTSLHETKLDAKSVGSNASLKSFERSSILENEEPSRSQVKKHKKSKGSKKKKILEPSLGNDKISLASETDSRTIIGTKE